MDRMTKSDKAVINAFMDHRGHHSGTKLQTDGKRLDIISLGGNGVAYWEGGKVHLPDTGSRSGQYVQRWMLRNYPKNDFFNGRGWNPQSKERRGSRNPMACGDLSDKRCDQLNAVYDSAIEQGYSKRRAAQQARGVVRKQVARDKRKRSRRTNPQWIRVPGGFLREGMIVKAPEYVLDEDGFKKTWAHVWAPDDAPSRLRVDFWDWEDGESDLKAIDEHGGELYGSIDSNVLDYPEIWLVEASSIDDLDDAARRQGQYPPDPEGNPHRQRREVTQYQISYDPSSGAVNVFDYGTVTAVDTFHIRAGLDAYQASQELEKRSYSTVNEPTKGPYGVISFDVNRVGNPMKNSASAPFDRVPSTKKLAEAFRLDATTAKKVHAVLQGDEETIDAVLGPSNVLSYQSGRMPARSLAMEAANKLLEMHGVEVAMRKPWEGMSSPHDFEYLNSGDTYNTTLLFRGRRVWISTWGDEVEGLERRGIRFENPRHNNPSAPSPRATNPSPRVASIVRRIGGA